MVRGLVWFLFVPALFSANRDPLSYVNPLIGTKKSKIGYGGTMPFVSPPFAMTNWTPQTRQNKISVTSYEYDDPAITGFIGTHQPAIWMGDYGYISLMPQTGELRTAPEARGLAFSHSDEIANPDYYAVSLRLTDSARIRAEMTATERCAFFRFRFPSAGVAHVLIEISRAGVPGFAVVDPKTHEITGYNPHRMDRSVANTTANGNRASYRLSGGALLTGPPAETDDLGSVLDRLFATQPPFEGFGLRELGRLVSTSSFVSFSATPNRWETPLITGQVRREVQV